MENYNSDEMKWNGLMLKNVTLRYEHGHQYDFIYEKTRAGIQ
jgi:hypothetical protein